MINKNNYYRMYDFANDVVIYFPDGARYMLEGYDAKYSFKEFSPTMIDDSTFTFDNVSEAKRFEDKVVRLAQEYFYNVRGNCLNAGIYR